LSALDDELDAELRRLFGDERLAVQAKAGAPQAIAAGARRIRRRRALLTSAAGVTMAAVVVVGGLALGPFHSRDDAAALSSKTLETASSGPSPSVPPSTPPTTAYPAPPLQTAHLPGRDDETPPRKTPSPKSSAMSVPTTLVPAGPELGPDSYGKLKLGMTEEAAAAQDLTLVKTDTTDTCVYYDITGVGIPSAVSAAMSHSLGLVMIVPGVVAHTPEGIGPGSTKDDVLKQYPATVDNGSGTFSPTGKGSTYQFDFDPKGQVQRVILNSANQDCAG
jgi:hypothetical protein